MILEWCSQGILLLCKLIIVIQNNKYKHIDHLPCAKQFTFYVLIHLNFPQKLLREMWNYYVK